MKCWFYRCVFGYDWYLEWDKRNTKDFGYEKNPECFTLYVSNWRLLVSDGNCNAKNPYNPSNMRNNGRKKARADSQKIEARTIELRDKVRTLFENHRKVS